MLGLVMFTRSFWTPLGTGHRIGYRLGGCMILLPLVALIAALTAIAALYAQR